MATQIEQSLPGRVTSVNKVVYRPDGSILTDLDIELDNIVIQVKTGGGVLKEATNNGFKVFTNMDDLIEFISQN